MNKESNVFGLGKYQSEHVFLVDIPSGRGGRVKIYECFTEFDEFFFLSEGSNEINERKELKADISRKQWNLISSTLKFEFNQYLKQEGKRISNWKVGGNLLEKLKGKELLLLVWAIEDTDNQLEVKQAILNWKGLSREERWWLFTITNAATGNLYDNDLKNKNLGWRSAIKTALISNPVDTKKECDINE